MKNSLNIKSLVLIVPILVIVTLLIIIGLGHIFNSSWVGEQSVSSGYIQKSYGLITDAPHATSELFYSTIENIIVLSIGYIWGKKALKNQHQELDSEHGYSHN
jgi:hypothetical protein